MHAAVLTALGEKDLGSDLADVSGPRTDLTFDVALVQLPDGAEGLLNDWNVATSGRWMASGRSRGPCAMSSGHT